MKNLYIDANVLVSFLTRRIESQYVEARELFVKAREEGAKIVLIPEIIIETAYVLETHYQVSRKDIHESLKELLENTIVKVINGHIILQALEFFDTVSVDLPDIYLYLVARDDDAEVFSFDKDLEKLKNRL